jgi:hypothetical protein
MFDIVDPIVQIDFVLVLVVLVVLVLFDFVALPSQAVFC